MSIATPYFFAIFARSSWHSLKLGLCQGFTAPSARVFDSSGITSPKSTPITRPKPRQVSQAPIGELNENRLGVGVGVGDVAVGAVQARLLNFQRVSPPSPLARRVHGEPAVAGAQADLQRLHHPGVLGVRRGGSGPAPPAAACLPSRALLDAGVALAGQQARSPRPR